MVRLCCLISLLVVVRRLLIILVLLWNVRKGVCVCCLVVSLLCLICWVFIVCSW